MLKFIFEKVLIFRIFFIYLNKKIKIIYYLKFNLTSNNQTLNFDLNYFLIII